MDILENISLKEKNWFKTGGNAQFYCEPQTKEDFAKAVAFAKSSSLSIHLLGDGANILVSDNGVKGLVVAPKTPAESMFEVVAEDDEFVDIRVGAGKNLDEFIAETLDSGFTGLEVFSAIPGTIGGSVYINVHYFERLLDQDFVSGSVISKDGEILEDLPKDWFEFGYDKSKLHEKNHFLIDAVLRLKKSNPEEVAYAKGRRFEIDRHRKRRYPYKNTCGSFFRNFLEDEVTLEIAGKKMIYIAYYLDKLGVKGELSVGGAKVSSRHANMIETSDSATTADVVELVRKMQTLVQTNYGILPQPECQLLGFETYPFISK